MPAWPQASTSVVRGSVRDATEAVIPSAVVTLTGAATNVERKTTTNAAGLFVFPGVAPGPYRIVVESPGMQRFEGALTVQVQVDAEVDAVLKVGQTALAWKSRKSHRWCKRIPPRWASFWNGSGSSNCRSTDAATRTSW